MNKKPRELWVIREEFETNGGRVVEYHGVAPDKTTARHTMIRRIRAIAQDCNAKYDDIYGLFERQELANGGIVLTNDVNKIEIYPVKMLNKS